MKLRTRLVIGIGSIVVALGLTMVLLAVALGRTVGGYDRLLAQEERLAGSAMDTHIQMLRARKAERDFILRPDEKDVTRHGEALGKLRKTIAAMQSIPLQSLTITIPADGDVPERHSPLATVLEETKAGVAEYASAFADAVDACRKRGLTQDQGTQKTFREAAHLLEQSLAGDGHDALLVKLLQIRRSEKDYMLRLRSDGAKYRDRTLAAIETLRGNLDALDDKRELALAAVSTYKAAFLVLVANDAALLAAEERLRMSCQRVEPLIDAVHQSAEAASGQASTAVAETANGWRWLSLPLAAGGVLAGLAFAIWQATSIAKPVIATATVLARVARGDFREGMSSNRQDEVGDMARAVDSTVAALRGTVADVASEARKVASEVKEVERVSTAVASASEENAREAQTAASSAEEVSSSTATVAASAEELSAAITEISRSVNEVSGIASEANSKAAAAHDEMQALGKASTEIGCVVQLIRGIAEQTNLLALNATIEAARAGDAGRGFAVVAGEVKALARQTAEATQRIEELVAGVQGRTGSAQTAIGAVAEVVRRIAEIQTSIAGAVEEQSATTKEITRAVGDVSTGVAEITRSINGVSQAADLASRTSAEARTTAAHLQAVSKELDAVVSRFQVA